MEYRRGRITREYRRWDGMACAVISFTSRAYKPLASACISRSKDRGPCILPEICWWPVGSRADRNVNVSDASDKATRVFGYAKDALATDDRVNLISDQRQQLRSVLTAGWRIDDGIHQSAAVVAQRGVRRREQEGIIANVALCGRKRLPHHWQMAKMKPSHDTLDGLVPETLRGHAMHGCESLAVVLAVGGQHHAPRRLQHPPQFAQRGALVGDQEQHVVSHAQVIRRVGHRQPFRIALDRHHG